MPRKRCLRVLVFGLIFLIMLPSYIFLASSSSGYIRVNGKTASTPNQQVQAGGNVSLYFGEVTWSGSELYLLMSLDNYQQVSIPDIIYTPRFTISDLTNTTTKTYTNDVGAWIVGNNWVNGTIAQSIPVGNYFIKAFDEVSGTVAITDVFIIVYSVIYSSSLQISPPSGPGGVSAQFTGSGFPPSSDVTISYFDPAFGSWNPLTTATANASGNITFTSEIPDLKKSLGMGDYPEAYTRVSYRAEIHGVVYCYVDYNQYSRGLKNVGNQTANGLYGNGTNLASTVNLATGDNLTLSGKWFHPGNVVYVRWDGSAVVGTVTGNEWLNAIIIGNSIANASGSFETSVTIPTANAGMHYLSIEDSQTRFIVRIYVSISTLYISPASGPGGITVDFTGSRYPPSEPITISYLDPKFSTWNVFGTTTSNSSGSIQFSAEMPDLGRSLTGYDSYEITYPVSFRTEQGSTIYCYADYNENARGLKKIGNQTANGLYGNGTNLASIVNLASGDALTISGKWFHPGDVVYIRWDGQAVVGTVTGEEWLNAAIIGNSIVNSSGYFQTTAIIPAADVGAHYVSVEDSQAKVIIKVAVVQTPENPDSKASSTIDFSCTSTTTYIGYKVEINGTLSGNSTPIAEEPILLSYSVTEGSSWEGLTTVYTGSDGGFSAEWMPSVTGNYLIKARWQGNSTINETSTVVALAIAPYAEQNIFSVASNSTVSELSFNATSSELSFNVTGSSGTAGFVDIAIAKSLIPDIADLRISVDGVNYDYTVTSTVDSWFLHFNYTHSTHNVIVTLVGNAPAVGGEYATVSNLQLLAPYLIVAFMGAGAIVSLVMYRKKSK